MSLINSLEPKFGRWAIPSLLRVVAMLQIAAFVAVKMNPAYEHLLEFDPEKIRQLELWRVFTFALLPRTQSILFIFFAVAILFLVNDILEQAWGAFRLNVYYFGSIALVNVTGFFFPDAAWSMTGWLLSMLLFMAASIYAPNYELNLYGLLPVKMKWLGVLDGVLVAWFLFSFLPGSMPVGGALLVPFLWFSLPMLIRQLRHETGTAIRRAKFQSAASVPGASFHACRKCGVTDKKDPHAEFRVAADGEEYCVPCLKAGAGGA